MNCRATVKFPWDVPPRRLVSRACLLREPIRARGTVPLKQESTDSAPQPSPAVLPAPVSAHWGERTRAHAAGVSRPTLLLTVSN